MMSAPDLTTWGYSRLLQLITCHPTSIPHPKDCSSTSSTMAGPLSVEDILSKQKADREAAAKVRHPSER